MPRPWPAPIQLPQERRRWALAPAATALLLAATLLVAYLSLFRQNDEPAVIVVSGQEVYAADYVGNRVQKFRLLTPLGPEAEATPEA